MKISRSFGKLDQPASIAGSIVPAIREAIISGELPAGARLSEIQLAKQFDISRTPVREALDQLDSEQLVDVIPYVGSRVRPIRLRDVEEIYQIRIALETMAVSLIVPKLTAMSSARIKQMLEELKSSANGDDSERFARARDDFHLLIVDLSENSVLKRLYCSLNGPIRRLRRIVKVEGQTPSPMHRNIEVAEAILAKSPNAADRIRDHLHNAMQNVIAALRAQGFDE